LRNRSAGAVPPLGKRKEGPGDFIVVRGLRQLAGPHLVNLRLRVTHGFFDARREHVTHCAQQSFKLNFTHVRLSGLAYRVPETAWAPVAEIAKIVWIEP